MPVEDSSETTRPEAAGPGHLPVRTSRMDPCFGFLTAFLSLRLLLVGSLLAGEAMHPRLPDEVVMNRNAGRGDGLLVPLRLESGETAEFLVDTGSSGTLVDKSLESKLGKRLGITKVSMFGKNEQTSGIYAAPKLFLGKIQLITGGRVRTYDFNPQSSHILGLLGMDCLKHYCIQWDFQAGRMRFLDPEHQKVQGFGKAYPIITSRAGRPFIVQNSLTGDVRTNTPVTTREFPPTYALIDSGYSADGRVDTGTNGPGRIHLSECVWDGQTYTNLGVGQGENANLLGLRFLARHLVTLDFPNQVLYLKQTSVGPLVRESSNQELKP